ncbi:hypothetical protein DRQ17_03015 [bacterium]|nr:MAG: hypothetical protein DRQ17_03015 [bacterium]
MKRFLLLFIFLTLILLSAPYRPYPILFVHGLGSGSGCWGASPDTLRSDWIYKDSIIDNSTMDNFLSLMKPYAWAWYDWEKEQYPNEISTYTPDTTVEEPSVKARYPNKSFLEVVNMDDPWGSVDAIHENDLDYYGYESPDYTSWQDELYHRHRYRAFTSSQLTSPIFLYPFF